MLANILLNKGNTAFRRAVTANSELPNWVFSSTFDYAFPDVHVVDVQFMVTAILMICSCPGLSFTACFKSWGKSFRGPCTFDLFPCQLSIENFNFRAVMIRLLEVSHAIIFDPPLQNTVTIVTIVALPSHYLARSCLEGGPLSLSPGAILLLGFSYPNCIWLELIRPRNKVALRRTTSRLRHRITSNWNIWSLMLSNRSLLSHLLHRCLLLHWYLVLHLILRLRLWLIGRLSLGRYLYRFSTAHFTFIF